MGYLIEICDCLVSNLNVSEDLRALVLTTLSDELVTKWDEIVAPDVGELTKLLSVQKRYLVKNYSFDKFFEKLKFCHFQANVDPNERRESSLASHQQALTNSEITERLYNDL